MNATLSEIGFIATTGFEKEDCMAFLNFALHAIEISVMTKRYYQRKAKKDDNRIQRKKIPLTCSAVQPIQGAFFVI